MFSHPAVSWMKTNVHQVGLETGSTALSPSLKAQRTLLLYTTSLAWEEKPLRKTWKTLLTEKAQGKNVTVFSNTENENLNPLPSSRSRVAPNVLCADQIVNIL